MDNREAILKEVDKHRGELVLDIHEVVMLVGFAEDAEDYYYKYLKSNGEEIKSSCVGNFIPLKPYLPKKEYESMCDIFYINAIEPYLKYFQDLENQMKKSMGRKPTMPIWG